MIKFKKSEEFEYNKFKVDEKKIRVDLIGLIMVKNQENNILNALDSIYNLCDSIIVVDTGSTDKTVDNIKKSYPDVTLNHLPWEENYAKMRNQCLEFVPNDSWVLFIDSDETINSALSYKEIHSFLFYLDNKYSNIDKICTVKQIQPNRPVFFRPERFIKKTKTLKYFGYVHEEPRSSNKNGLIKFDIDIDIMNLGLTKGESEKFDKKNRYYSLMLKNMAEEPDNPRWISLITPPMIDNNFMDRTEYIDILKQHILINKSESIEISNINRGSYLPYLLEKYIMELIKTNNDTLANEYIKIARKILPYQSNFVVFEMMIFLKKIKLESKDKLDEIVCFIDSNDINLIHESSEGSEEALSLMVAHLLCTLGEYDQVKDLYSTVSDEEIKYLMLNEISILE